jgi:hypothetical protein
MLVLDALRFDLGATLAERIDSQEGVARSSVQPARAPLPSITALGMGMALPIVEDQLVGRHRGWQVAVDRNRASDNLSRRREAACMVADQRASTLSLRRWTPMLGGPVPGLRRSLQAPGDLRCHHRYHGARRPVGLSRQRAGAQAAICEAVEHLRNRGWLRILIVTDHGYIHWPVNEEKSSDLPAPDPAYASRRALAYPPTVALPQPAVLAPGGRWRMCAAARCSQLSRLWRARLLSWRRRRCKSGSSPASPSSGRRRAQPCHRARRSRWRASSSQRPRLKLRVEPTQLLREDSIARTGGSADSQPADAGNSLPQRAEAAND